MMLDPFRPLSVRLYLLYITLGCVVLCLLLSEVGKGATRGEQVLRRIQRAPQQGIKAQAPELDQASPTSTTSTLPFSSPASSLSDSASSTSTVFSLFTTRATPAPATSTAAPSAQTAIPVVVAVQDDQDLDDPETEVTDLGQEGPVDVDVGADLPSAASSEDSDDDDDDDDEELTGRSSRKRHVDDWGSIDDALSSGSSYSNGEGNDTSTSEGTGQGGADDFFQVLGVEDVDGRTLVVSTQCTGAMARPLLFLHRLSLVSLLLILFELWLVGIAVLGVWNGSVPHLIAVTVLRLVLVGWAIASPVSLTHYHDLFHSLLLSHCAESGEIIAGFWDVEFKIQVAIAVLQAVMLGVVGRGGWGVAKTLRWQTFRTVGADPSKTRSHNRSLAFKVGVLVAGGWVIGFQSLWLHTLLTYPWPTSLVSHHPMLHSTPYRIIFTVLTASFPFLLLFGWVAERKKSWKMTAGFCVLVLGVEAHAAWVLSRGVYKETLHAFPFLTFLSAASVSFLTTLEVLAGWSCWEFWVERQRGGSRKRGAGGLGGRGREGLIAVRWISSSSTLVGSDHRHSTITVAQPSSGGAKLGEDKLAGGEKAPEHIAIAVLLSSTSTSASSLPHGSDAFSTNQSLRRRSLSLSLSASSSAARTPSIASILPSLSSIASPPTSALQQARPPLSRRPTLLERRNPSSSGYSTAETSPHVVLEVRTNFEGVLPKYAEVKNVVAIQDMETRTSSDQDVDAVRSRSSEGEAQQEDERKDRNHVEKVDLIVAPYHKHPPLHSPDVPDDVTEDLNLESPVAGRASLSTLSASSTTSRSSSLRTGSSPTVANPRGSLTRTASSPCVTRHGVPPVGVQQPAAAAGMKTREEVHT
ncbi:hypothetical protein JCM11641_002704 [Rhodosporidiobolus odoratus]